MVKSQSAGIFLTCPHSPGIALQGQDPVASPSQGQGKISGSGIQVGHLPVRVNVGAYIRDQILVSGPVGLEKDVRSHLKIQVEGGQRQVQPEGISGSSCLMGFGTGGQSNPSVVHQSAQISDLTAQRLGQKQAV
jgi:hypothetical protein